MVSLKHVTRFAALSFILDAQVAAEDIGPNLNYPRPPETQYSFPSPNATGMGGWDIAISKAKRFVGRLTLEEKVGICTGIGFG